MPQVLPIRGLRYTPQAGPLGSLLAPPYDIIGEAQRRGLAARSPYNAVHLELAGGGEGRYGEVARTLQDWLSTGVLARDAVPMLYVYSQDFEEGGRQLTRSAVLAGVEAQPWEEGAVKPHEFTMSAPKEDRLRLLEATRVQFSPVFLVARDRAGQLRQFIEATMASEPAAVGTTPEGDKHRLWAIEAGRYEMRMLAPLFSESFYVADGHHRYETAVAYRQRLAASEPLPPDHPARFALAAVVAADDPGLVIRPIHRFVPRQPPADWLERLAPIFDVAHLKQPVGVEREQLNELHLALSAHPRRVIAIGLEPEQVHVLTVNDEGGLASRLPAGCSAEWGLAPANIVRYGILEPLFGLTDSDLEAGAVEYTHDMLEVWDRVDTQRPDACGFLLNPIAMSTVMSLADAGQRLPQKTTFFYPKLATGMVFHPLYQ